MLIVHESSHKFFFSLHPLSFYFAFLEHLRKFLSFHFLFHFLNLFYSSFLPFLFILDSWEFISFVINPQFPELSEGKFEFVKSSNSFVNTFLNFSFFNHLWYEFFPHFTDFEFEYDVVLVDRFLLFFEDWLYWIWVCILNIVNRVLSFILSRLNLFSVERCVEISFYCFSYHRNRRTLGLS